MSARTWPLVAVSATVRTMKPARRAHLVDESAQAPALALARDPPRDADVAHRRHEHDVAPGQRDVRGDPRALARDRVLHDLDEDLLAGAHELGDVEVLAAAPRDALVVVLDGRGRARRRGGDVARVQERGLVLADVDEGGLHAGEHAQDLALVHVAHGPALALALDVELGQDPVLDQGDPGLRAIGVDNNDGIRHGGGAFLAQPGRPVTRDRASKISPSQR
jgi:hypothetical protein